MTTLNKQVNKLLNKKALKRLRAKYPVEDIETLNAAGLVVILEKIIRSLKRLDKKEKLSKA